MCLCFLLNCGLTVLLAHCFVSFQLASLKGVPRILFMSLLIFFLLCFKPVGFLFLIISVFEQGFQLVVNFIHCQFYVLHTVCFITAVPLYIYNSCISKSVVTLPGELLRKEGWDVNVSNKQPSRGHERGKSIQGNQDILQIFPRTENHKGVNDGKGEELHMYGIYMCESCFCNNYNIRSRYI